jgi:acyl carrier protein
MEIGLRDRQMSVRATITSEIGQIAVEQSRTLPPLQDDLVLHETGFDSLCFAILVSRLEDSLGIDPFSMSNEVYYPTTLGEFIGFYEKSAA